MQTVGEELYGACGGMPKLGEGCRGAYVDRLLLVEGIEVTQGVLVVPLPGFAVSEVEYGGVEEVGGGVAVEHGVELLTGAVEGVLHVPLDVDKFPVAVEKAVEEVLVVEEDALGWAL